MGSDSHSDSHNLWEELEKSKDSSVVGAKAQEGCKGKKVGCEDENDPTEREVPMMQEKRERCRRDSVGR